MQKQRTLTADIIAALLIINFSHSALSIAIYPGFPSLKNCLAFYTSNTTAWSATILIANLVTAVLLFFPATRLWGFVSGLLLTIGFAFLILTYSWYPHHFGGLLNYLPRIQKWVLLISIACSSLAGIIFIRINNRKRPVPESTEQIIFT